MDLRLGLGLGLRLGQALDLGLDLGLGLSLGPVLPLGFGPLHHLCLRGSSFVFLQVALSRILIRSEKVTKKEAREELQKMYQACEKSQSLHQVPSHLG